MARPTLFASFLSSLLILTSCSSNQPSTPSPQGGVLRDTLGKAFALSCSAYFCELIPNDPTLVPAASGGPVSCSIAQGTDTYMLVLGRVLTVHLMNYPGSGLVVLNAADPAHPVACASDVDCAPGNFATANHAYAYSCVNGICQDPGVGLVMRDVIALCQADIPWPTACPYITSPRFASRLDEIATLCARETNCQSIPADCWQLVPSADGGATSVGSADGGATKVEPVDATIAPGEPDGGSALDLMPGE